MSNFIPNEVIPHGKHQITEADKRAVIAALEADFITQGPIIPRFEEAFAQYIGATHAVALANGTAALHLCAMALGVESGLQVITSPITFVATANCIRYCGGEVLFADIDPNTYTLDPNKVEAILRKPGHHIKGIIPVDLTGRMADMEAFRFLADRYGLWLIEDACHAPGGYMYSSDGRINKAGDGQLADMAIFSFHPVKHIACGEGGMITTRNAELDRKVRLLRTHGITKDPAEMDHYEGGWYYQMQELGYNYRLTDFQAAFGLSQLERAAENIEKRRKIAEVYSTAFGQIQGILHHSGFVEGHAYHLYVIQVEDRKGLYDFLRTKMISCQIHYIPVHLQPYYRQFGWKEGDFPHAESYYRHCLSIPMYPSLEPEQQHYVIECIREFLEAGDEGLKMKD
jgi:UDP-4-amino-4,6-dideoxy-N-acetyl-beta-L-altrosamine transaminase